MGDWFLRFELNAAATDQQAEIFAHRIGSTTVNQDLGRTSVNMYIGAESLRQAVSDGLESVNTVAASAGLKATVIQVEAKPESDRIRELATPSAPSLVGVAEIQEILQIKSRQQVDQLAAKETFPRPLAELRAGRIWLRSDIEEFRRRWQRKPGRGSSFASSGPFE